MDMQKRIGEHNEGLSSYTSKFVPWEIVYSEHAASRANALKREKQLKSQKGREFIWKIVKDKFLSNQSSNVVGSIR